MWTAGLQVLADNSGGEMEAVFQMIFEDNKQAWNLEENAILHLLEALGKFYSKTNILLSKISPYFQKDTAEQTS